MPVSDRMKTRTGEVAVDKLPNGQIVWAYNARGEPICNSRIHKTKAKPEGGRRCKATIGLFLNGRCCLHGGSSPVGIESATFKNGRFSLYRASINEASRDKFDTLMADEEYMSLKPELAIARIRLISAIDEYGELDAESLGRLVRYTDFAEELLEGEFDTDDLEGALRDMIRTTRQVVDRAKAGEQVDRRSETVRKLADTEVKKYAADQNSIPAARALFLFQYLIESMRLHFKAERDFLRQCHPTVVVDERLPNPLQLVAKDIEPYLPKGGSMGREERREEKKNAG